MSNRACSVRSYTNLAFRSHVLILSVDNIEANIESAAVRTGDAAVELDGARRYQKKAQKRLVCLMLTFGVIVGIIILVLVLR